MKPLRTNKTAAIIIWGVLLGGPMLITAYLFLGFVIDLPYLDLATTIGLGLVFLALLLSEINDPVDAENG